MFEFDSEFFNLNQIADSGQCFRWQEIFCDNESKKYHYQVPVKDKLLNIFQDDKKIKIDCTESEFESFWKNYFDFNTDYKKITSLIVDDEYLQRAIKYGYGIRILNQDLWEMIISFIISQNNNIPRNFCAIIGFFVPIGRLEEITSFIIFPSVRIMVLPFIAI